MKQTQSLANNNKKKRRILMCWLLFPLTVIGVALGVALPLSWCSCNNGQPIGASWTISNKTGSNNNFDTFLNGSATTGQIYGYKNSFTDYLKQNNVSKIVFDIDSISIADFAFYGCDGLDDISKKIALEFTSATTISLGDEAFSVCHSISLIIVSSITSPILNFVNVNTFANCSNLKGFSRGGQLGKISTNINDYSLVNCPNLEVAMIDDNILNISGCTWIPGNDDNSGFWFKSSATALHNSGCLAVGKITCPFTSIGSNAFDGCASITEITNIPGGQISSSSFAGCVNLTTIQFKNDIPLTSVGAQAFIYTSRLNSIRLSSFGWTNGSSIANDAFVDCGLNGGSISGTNASGLLSAIQTQNYLLNWIAI